MARPRKATYAVVTLGILGGLAAFLRPWAATPAGDAKPRPVADAPAAPGGLEEAPPEVRAFLERVLAAMPDAGAGVADYQFRHWERVGSPTREAFGIKAVPGIDPEALIGRVLDVDHYVGHIAHVEESRSVPDPRFAPPDRVRVHQRLRVPAVALVRQELELVDAGTIHGYRVVYWSLLEPETAALDPSNGVRNAYNVGAWFAAPGVVGYALNSWPRREDVNMLQWASLTRGADRLASAVVERTIDGMAAWTLGQGGEPEPGDGRSTAGATIEGALSSPGH